MIIWRVDRLMPDADIGHFETIGFARCDIYSTRRAIEASEMVFETMMAGYGIDVQVIRWTTTHMTGDAITGWTWRVRQW